jgi:hypothetical protein
MRNLLSSGVNKFDPVILRVFLSRMSVYPIGSIVEINDGSIGIIIDQFPKKPLRPIIKLIFDGKKNKVSDTIIVNLLENSSLYLVRAMDESKPASTSSTYSDFFYIHQSPYVYRMIQFSHSEYGDGGRIPRPEFPTRLFHEWQNPSIQSGVNMKLPAATGKIRRGQGPRCSLIEQGFTIIGRNLRYGRRGEIDIAASRRVWLFLSR